MKKKKKKKKKTNQIVIKHGTIELYFVVFDFDRFDGHCATTKRAPEHLAIPKQRNAFMSTSRQPNKEQQALEEKNIRTRPFRFPSPF
jgi:hypothetical protein